MEKENRFNITECSPTARAKITSFDDSLWAPYINRKGFYPYGELKIGECFTIPIAGILDNGTSLRTMTYKWSKRLNRKFAVIKHSNEHQCFEIARIG